MGSVGVLFHSLWDDHRSDALLGVVEVLSVWEVQGSFSGGVVGVVVQLDLCVVGEDAHNGDITWLCGCCQPW